MKKTLLIFACALVFAGTVSTSCAQNATDKVEWKEFQSAENGFKVEFPKPPTRSLDETKVPNRIGPSVEFDTELPSTSFLVKIGEFLNSAPSAETELTALYDDIRNSVAEGMHAKVLREQRVTASGKVGRDVELAVDGHYVKYRMFFVGSRFYQLIISTNSEFAADTSVQKSMNRFMDSFQLIEKNQGSM
jgi:hypothetical protein